MKNVLISAPLVLYGLLCLEARAQQAYLIGLGGLPSGEVNAAVSGVSPNGEWVVGFGSSTPGTQAIVWSQATGMIALGELPGWDFLSLGAAVANNGTAVGRSHSGNVTAASGNAYEAFRWTQATGMIGMGDLPGSPFWSEAAGISADGLLIVGQGFYGVEIGAPWIEAWRWTAQTGLRRIGRLGMLDSYATGVSADGSVVVGRSHLPGLPFREAAFRWEAGTMVGLGFLQPQHDFSYALAVSGDGRTVVGLSRGGGETNRAFRWTGESGMAYLGDMPDGLRTQIAYAVSHDGAIVAGAGASAKGFIWDAQHGSRWIGDILVEDYGLDISLWLRLGEIRGMSGDGRIVVGSGFQYDTPGSTTTHGEAFLAYLPTLPCDLPGNVDGNCVVDLRDAAAMLGCLAGPGAAAGADCARADLDGDGDADLADFAAWQRVVEGGEVPAPCDPPAPMDLDGDCETTGSDFAAFADCMSGPDVPTACPAADADLDGDTDLHDFALLQRLFPIDDGGGG